MIPSTRKMDFVLDVETTDSEACATWIYYPNFHGCRITFYMNNLIDKTDEQILSYVIHEFVHEIFKQPWEYYTETHYDGKSRYFFNLMEKSTDDITHLLLPLFLRYIQKEK